MAWSARRTSGGIHPAGESGKNTGQDECPEKVSVQVRFSIWFFRFLLIACSCELGHENSQRPASGEYSVTT
jgi:hypothetical protein